MIRDEARFKEWMAAFKAHAASLLNADEASIGELDLLAVRMAEAMEEEGTADSTDSVVERIRKDACLFELNMPEGRKILAEWFASKEHWIEAGKELAKERLKLRPSARESLDGIVREMERMPAPSNGRPAKAEINGCPLVAVRQPFTEWASAIPHMPPDGRRALLKQGKVGIEPASGLRGNPRNRQEMP